MRTVLQLLGIAVMCGAVFAVVPVAMWLGLWWALFLGPLAAGAVAWIGGQIYLAA